MFDFFKNLSETYNKKTELRIRLSNISSWYLEEYFKKNKWKNIQDFLNNHPNVYDDWREFCHNFINNINQ